MPPSTPDQLTLLCFIVCVEPGPKVKAIEKEVWESGGQERSVWADDEGPLLFDQERTILAMHKRHIMSSEEVAELMRTLLLSETESWISNQS